MVHNNGRINPVTSGFDYDRMTSLAEAMEKNAQAIRVIAELGKHFAWGTKTGETFHLKKDCRGLNSAGEVFSVSRYEVEKFGLRACPGCGT